MPHIKGDPTKPTPDLGVRGLPLLDMIIEHAETHPETFEMRAWAVVRGFPGLTWDWTEEQGAPETCGSAMCIAGWAAHLTGAELIYSPQYAPSDFGNDLVLAADYVRVPGDPQAHFSPNRRQISHYAAEVLEMPLSVALEMFDSTNDLDTIKRLRREYIEEGIWSAGVQAAS